MPTFNTVFVLGYPAAGKTTLINHLMELPQKTRLDNFGIKEPSLLTDYAFMEQAFRIDNALFKVSKLRLFSDRNADHTGYITRNLDTLLDMTSVLISEEISFRIAKQHAFFQHNTVFVELCRGSVSPYSKTLALFEDLILNGAAILYLSVTEEEAKRRNLTRERQLPTENFQAFFDESDWHTLTNGRPQGDIFIRGIPIPFVSIDYSVSIENLTEIEGELVTVFNSLRTSISKPTLASSPTDKVVNG